MSNERPGVRSAKLDRLLEMMSDSRRLLALPDDERPPDVDIRHCEARCIESLRDSYHNARAVREETKLPSERLE